MVFRLNKYYLFTAVCSIFILQISACKVQKLKHENIESKNYSLNEENVSDSILNVSLSRLRENSLDFSFLNLRYKTNYTDDELNQQFTANIRIKKDSIIWISLTGAMGFEGARLAVTQDSFFLLNKLTKEYTVKPISYLSQIVPLNTNLQMFQNLLLAQPIELLGSNFRFYRTDSFDVIKQQIPKLQQTITVHQQNYTISEIMLADLHIKQDLQLTFGNYKNIGDKSFPFESEIIVNRGLQKINLKMELARYTINEPLVFPFEVNEHYKRK